LSQRGDLRQIEHLHWQALLAVHGVTAQDVQLRRIGASRQIPAEAETSWQQSLTQRRYFDALRDFPPPGERGEVLGGDEAAPTEAPTPSAGASENAMQVPALPENEFQEQVDIRSRLSTSLAVAAYRARTRCEIAWASGVQAVGVAAILVGASFAFFEDRFIGTAAELAGLFFFGFTADFSVAKLVDLAGAWAAKPKTGAS